MGRRRLVVGCSSCLGLAHLLHARPFLSQPPAGSPLHAYHAMPVCAWDVCVHDIRCQSLAAGAVMGDYGKVTGDYSELLASSKFCLVLPGALGAGV